MDKRGASPLYYMFELLGAILITLALVNIAHTAALGEDIQRYFLGRDTALMVDALHASPGNARIDYKTFPFNNSYDFSVEGNKISITHTILPTITSLFVADKRYDVAKTLITLIPSQENTLLFAKSGNKINIGANPEFDPRKLSCQLANISRNDLTKIYFDSDKESEAVLAGFRNVLTYGFSSSGELQDKITAMNSFNPSIIFMIRSTDESVRVNVPLNSNVASKNQRIACSLMNELIAQDPSIDLNIGPSDDDLLNSMKDKPVVLVTGNIDSTKLFKALHNAIGDIAED